MRLDPGLLPRRHDDSPVALTIGNFDGVHRGHAALLREVVAASRRLGIEAVVLTFDPHPRCVLDPAGCPLSLTVLDEKAELLQRHGVDRLVVLPFTPAVSRWTADEFCERLRQSFDLRALVVGHDFALGHKRQGNIPFLRSWTSRYGIEMHEVRPTLDESKEPVSSTRIRRLLEGGDIRGAEALLGHPYLIDGTPSPDAEPSGAPALQVSVPASKCLPARGTYAAWLHAEDGWRAAMLLVGEHRAVGGTLDAALEVQAVDGAPMSTQAPVRLAVRERLQEPGAAAGEERAAQLAALREEAGRVLEASGPPAI